MTSLKDALANADGYSDAAPADVTVGDLRRFAADEGVLLVSLVNAQIKCSTLERLLSDSNSELLLQQDIAVRNINRAEHLERELREERDE